MLITTLPALFRRRHDYDLVLVSGFRILGMPALLASRLLRKACVLKADSPGEMSGEYYAGGLSRLGLKPSFFPLRLILALRNRLFLKADSFVALSSDIRDELRSCGVPALAIRVIPNCVDTARFRGATNPEKRKLRERLGLPEDATIISYTGRLVSYKGLPLLLRVWKRLRERHPNAFLLLVGGGGLDLHDCEEELKRYAQQNALSPSVRFTGNVHNVEDYLRASDVFAFPTEIEAFGISLLEAMACELPAVSTPVGGIKDVIRHEENGLLVEPGSELQLEDALDRLLRNQGLAARLATTARATVLARYTVETVARQYGQHFREVILARRSER